MKTCFVLMPISDPPSYSKGHFRHVYEHFIKEACRRAGFLAIRADDVKATNVIVLDILNKIVSSDMVVCDLSARNPNVLYELGIRHALQRPVVLIKDDKTERIFDVSGLRTPEYDHLARGERLEQDIIALASAIRDTAAGSDAANSPLSLLSTETRALLTTGLQTFPSRDQLSHDTGLKHALKTATQFDFVGLSGEALITTFNESFVTALQRPDFNCRLVLLDPSESTEIHYNRMVELVGRNPEVTRAQARHIFRMVARLNGADGGSRRVEVKVIRNSPLLYNLWLARDATGRSIGHVSIYSYHNNQGGPSFRVHDAESPLLRSLKAEFDWTWNNVAESPDPSRT